MPIGLRGAKGQERKQFFFEKKNQKTFDYYRLALQHRAHQYAKVFASFFKKKRFLALDGAVSTLLVSAGKIIGLTELAPAVRRYAKRPLEDGGEVRLRLEADGQRDIHNRRRRFQ